MCEYMKQNTMAKLLNSLEHDEVEVLVGEDVRRKAQAAIDRMLTIQ
jgi:quinolinate synthase